MNAMNSTLNGDSISPEVVTQIKAKLDEIRQLMPFAVGLSPQERKTHIALGSKGTQFVQLALECMRQNPSLVPPYVDVAAAENWYAMYNALMGIEESMLQLTRLVEDTMHMAGNQARSQSLEFYNSVQRGANANVPGSQALYESLKPWFKKARNSTSPASAAKATADVIR